MAMSGSNAFAGSGAGGSASMSNSWGDIGKGVAGGIGGFASLAKLFSDSPDYNNPAKTASPYLDRIPETLRPYFQRYIDQGQQVDPTLQGQYTSMASNPSDFLKNISQGYQQSPGYQFRLNQALGGANNAAAAGGMLGSPAHQQQNEQVAEGLANQDYEGWLNHVMGLFGQGQTGLQGISNRSFGASTGYGENLANSLMNQAGLAYQGEAEQNKYNQAESNARNQAFGDVAGFAAKMIPFL